MFDRDPDDRFLGQSYVRALIAKAAAYVAMRAGDYSSPGEIAQKRWGKTHPGLVQRIKAGVPGGATTSGAWGSELAQSDTRFVGDFVEYLNGLTLFDRLPLRPVPGNVHIAGQEGAAIGYWVGEGRATPVTSLDFFDVELKTLRAATIAVCSRKLIADASHDAEMLIRDAIGQAIAKKIDTTFLSAAAGTAGVSPPGLLNGVSALSPSGTDADAVRADFAALVAPFMAAKNAAGLVHVMTPSMGLALSLMVNALGNAEFPEIDERGGKLFKRPVYTGDNVTAGDWLVLKPSDIWRIGASEPEVSMSDTATLEQDNAPTGDTTTPTAASATFANMWQSESVAFKIVRTVNYAKRRTPCVSRLSGAEYGGVVS